MKHSEKVDMYRMIEKDTLIEMLIEANMVINRLTEVKNLSMFDVRNTYCTCKQSQCYLMNGGYICTTCNKSIAGSSQVIMNY